MSPFIQSLHVYPIKSCRGILLEQATLGHSGIEYDRRWMLVDPNGRFLSQRRLPQMALIRCRFEHDQLVVSAPGHDDLWLELNQPVKIRRTVEIWNDHCHASQVSDAADNWFSSVLEQTVTLVFLPDDEPRPVDPDYAKKGTRVGFADGFPLLLLSQASADLLGEKLGESIDIRRFRPNLVIGGCPAHAEDHWNAIKIDQLLIQLVKPCSRCVVPSIDPVDATRHPALLRTLAAYRRRDGKVYFGQNALYSGTGIIRTGQDIVVLEH